VLDSKGEVIDPTEDETVILLRRMVQMLMPSAQKDAAGRQDVYIGASVALTANPASGTIGTVTTVNQVAGVDGTWLWRAASWATLAALFVAAVVVAVFLRRGFDVPAFSLAMVVPVLVAAGSLAGAVGEARSNRPGVVVAIATSLAAAYAIAGLHVAPGYLQDMQPISRLGGIIAAQARPGDRVAHYGGFGGPGLVYYSRHVVEYLRSPEEVAQFLEGDGRRFCVVSAADLEAVRRVAPREPHVLARQPWLTIRLMRVLRGRAADPQRALVLVSNDRP
jgi:hypothetical protein